MINLKKTTKAARSAVLLIALGSALPALAQTEDIRQTFPQVETTTPTGVNLQTGQFTERGVDMQFGPFSVDHFARYVFYGGSAAAANKPEAVATSLMGHSRYLEQGDGREGGQVTKTQYVQLGESQLSFAVQSGGTYFPVDSSTTGWKLVKSGADDVLTGKSGVTYRYSPHPAVASTYKVLVRKVESDKHQLDYSYTSSGKVKLIESSRGYALVFAYGTNTTTVCGYNTTKVSVSTSTGCASSDFKATYNFTNGLLTSVTDAGGSTIELRYTNGKLTCVTLPDSSTCRITNYYSEGPGNPSPPDNRQTLSKKDQVLQQVTATGEVWDFSHIPVDDDPTYTPYPGELRESYGSYGVVGSNVGASGVFKNGFLFEVSTPDTGKQLYDYSSTFTFTVTYKTHTTVHYYSVYPSKITYPEGNSISFVRDYADNVVARTEVPKPGSGEASRTVSWQYPYANVWSSPTICTAADVLCDKVHRITDHMGNETDFVYNSTYGGLLSQTLPADGNGVRPQTRYTYSKKYAWIKSGSGYVQAPTGIWLLTREEYCRTSAATNVQVNTNSVTGSCAAGASDEMVTTYEYEEGSATKGSNLLLLGTAVTSEGVTLRSCVTYDEYGRKIAETKPLGTSGSCQ